MVVINYILFINSCLSLIIFFPSYSCSLLSLEVERNSPGFLAYVVPPTVREARNVLTPTFLGGPRIGFESWLFMDRQ